MTLNKALLTFIFSGLLATQLAFAKNLNLYDQPKSDAKIIGTINTDTGMIPIFSPKDGLWVKIADPNNGNVGWIRSSELKEVTGGYTFSQQYINTGTSPHGYRIIQFGQPTSMTPEQSQMMLKKMQQRQETLQKDMQLMIQDMFKNVDTSFPMIVPIIMVPEKPGAIKAAPSSSGTTNENKTKQ